MASTAAQMVIDDPEDFHLLTTDVKEKIIQAGIATVNVQAALTRKNAIENVRADFTLRNNFTTSQIQFQQMEKARFISLSAIQSKVGITEKAGYMARQETGGPHKAEGGTNLAIPTNLARGGNRGSPVLKSQYLSKLKKVRGGDYFRDGGTYVSKLVARAAVASKNNILMRHSDKLFSVTGFEKRGGKVHFKMQEIYGLDREETITPEMPWLKPATDKVAKDGEKIFISEMKKRGV
jgi:hypothetical protein